MEIRTCKRCKKIFQYAGGKPLCPICAKEEEAIFYEVKDYLSEHRNASLEQVSEETRATVQMIQGYIREGRIEVSAESPIALTCEKCGVSITTGRYCKACASSLMDKLQGAASSMSSIESTRNDSSRVAFLNRENYRG